MHLCRSCSARSSAAGSKVPDASHQRSQGRSTPRSTPCQMPNSTFICAIG
ncbi:hypothetical protein [Tychonema sp. LEGE 06208]|nr:hypothetical protein [Tychonema sp. LEGE 06208]